MQYSSYCIGYKSILTIVEATDTHGAYTLLTRAGLFHVIGLSVISELVRCCDGDSDGVTVRANSVERGRGVNMT